MKKVEFILYMIWEFIQMLYLIVMAVSITAPLYIGLHIIFFIWDMVKVPDNTQPEAAKELQFDNPKFI